MFVDWIGISRECWFYPIIWLSFKTYYELRKCKYFFISVSRNWPEIDMKIQIIMNTFPTALSSLVVSLRTLFCFGVVVLGFLFVCFLFLLLGWHCVAFWILVPQPGIEPRPLQWKQWILTTRLSGNFLSFFFFSCTFLKANHGFVNFSLERV